MPSKAQIILFWGPQLVCIYNDAYRPIFGSRHPWALGKAGPVAWDVIWPKLGPLLQGVVATGEAFSAPDLPFFIDRAGFLEEVYFDVSYDPVRDETGNVGGVFCIVSETTLRVLGERRLETLRELGATAAAVAADEAASCRDSVAAIEHDARDLPFAIAWLPDGDTWTIGAVTGSQESLLRGKGLLEPSAWPLRRAIETRQPVVVDQLELPELRLEGLPDGASPTRAVVLPLQTSDLSRMHGVLVVGVSAVLPLDQSYLDFLGLVARQVATAIANATAYKEEKQRAEALAEIDRAKTTFFSNVSHEFRTPLTLMLGPLEALAGAHNRLTSPATEDLDLALRNARRLLKLVNSLLDFSRIEAGRAQANYEAVDIAAYTAELASSFRSACEKAGLRLLLDCRPVRAPVYVDRDMWEKVVLNLVSNAFKFTLQGEIEVRVEEVGNRVHLVVRDTGVGIAAEQLPRMFARFHRIEGSRGRTHEGTGIGLALVRELVKLHGGDVEVESILGEGSRFRVVVPTGVAHLDPRRVGVAANLAPTGVGAGAFVDEALRWLPDRPVASEEPTNSGPRLGSRPRVLWADDNADMRAYVTRLLSDAFEVTSVCDGEAALTMARLNPPDVVLADVMMPRLDGFGLLAALRADPALRDTEVILLSARAGEEARVGLRRGADDYLVKPFSSRELIARVASHAETARVRRNANAALQGSERLFRTLADTAPTILWMTDPDGTCTFLSRGWYEYTGQTEREGLGFGWLEAVHPEDREGSGRIFRDANREQRSFQLDYRLRAADGTYGWFLDAGRPRFDANGFAGFVGTVTDITARKRSEQATARTAHDLQQVIDATPALIAYVDSDWRYRFNNKVYADWFGLHRAELLDQPVRQVLGEVTFRRLRPHMEAALAGHRVEFEDEIPRRDGSVRHVHATYVPDAQADGRVEGFYVLVTDITARKEAERALQLHATERQELLESEQSARRHAEQLNLLKDEFLATLSHELRTPLSAILGWVHLLKRDPGNRQRVEEGVQIIERNARMQTQLISDLLDMSRVVAGKMRVELGAVDLLPIVQAAIETLQPAADARGVAVVKALEPIGEVLGDASRLQQIVWNLLSNAVKFTPRGGTVSVELAQVESGTREPHARIRVRDTGHGIRAEFLPHVFDRFRQEDSSTTRSHGGLGLGLAIVKQLVELHGGTVHATSDGESMGATFTVLLPLRSYAVTVAPGVPSESTQSGVAPAASATPTPARGLRGVRVLLVDDDPEALDLLRRMLADTHAEIRTATSGHAARDALRTFAANVIVSDVGMPSEDGYQFLAKLRSEGIDVPAIAVTAFARPEDRVRALAKGYRSHLTKPVSLHDLVDAIASAAKGVTAEGHMDAAGS